MTRANRTWATVLVAVSAATLTFLAATGVSLAENSKDIDPSATDTVRRLRQEQQTERFESGSTWAGHCIDAPGADRYPMILYITERKDDRFKGTIWYPPTEKFSRNGATKCSGMIGHNGTITFSEYYVIHGGLTNHCSYVAGIDGTTLNGKCWHTNPDSDVTSYSKFSLSLAKGMILDPNDRRNVLPGVIDPPTRDEILRALPDPDGGGFPALSETERKNLRTVVELTVDRVGPSRYYPLIGPAKLRHCRYKCTVYFDKETRSYWPIPFTHTDDHAEVIFIDRVHFIR